jgi:hypothetical protein
VSGCSQAEINAAAVGTVTTLAMLAVSGVIVLNDSTDAGTNVDTAIHVAATVSLTAFLTLLI